MRRPKSRSNFVGSLFYRSLLELGGGVTLLAIVSASAQTTNVAGLREMRVACLESFSTAKTRLDELHVFVQQQDQREHSAANQLFQLQQSAATAKRRNDELAQEFRQCTNLLSRARKALDKATASYRAAVDAMPSGEVWASDGSAALNELRRAADASPRDVWKHKRVKEVEAEFVDTLRQWRAARRLMEQASFDLEVRATPSAFRRVAEQLDSVSSELKTLKTQLSERQLLLEKLSKQSEQWAAAMRELQQGEAQSREHLASVAFQFHLVDLKFAAWRLKHSELGDEGIEALPDVLEQSFESEPLNFSALASSGPPPPPATVTGLPASSENAATGAPKEEEKESVEEGDAAFRDLLARVTLAESRLAFVAEILQGEFNSVEAAIGALEKVEEQANELADSTAGLAANQESLRRSLQTEQQALDKGAETLDLVKKRFATDVKTTNELLDTAANRTAALEKSLEL